MQKYKKMIVSILGCGWIGLPLAIDLIKNGAIVKGSTTTNIKLKTFAEFDIKPYLIRINTDENSIQESDFFECDILIFSIPPSRNDKNVVTNFLKIAEFVKTQLIKKKVKKLIFLSSTSVYPLNNNIVNENDARPEKNSGKALLLAENLFLEISNLRTTVLRLGGLIGYERSAISLLKKKKEINNASSPLNLIHRDDCIEIVKKIIIENHFGYVFNACADEHPKRRDFYLNACRENNLPEPLFKDEVVSYKLVSNKFLKTTLNYTFKYPNPLQIDRYEKDK